jgi:site-specific recombinase XerD
MEKVLFNTVFNRKKKLLSDGTALIQVEAYVRGKKKYFSTNIYITPDQWDKKHHQIKNHPNQIKLNKQIKDGINDLERVELEYRQNGKVFTLETLSEYKKGNVTTSFIDFIRRELSESKQKPATITSERTMLNVLEEFRKDIQFNEINFELLSDFEKYLQNRSLHVNTIHKYFRHIKKYVNLAINKDLFDLNKYPFRKFKVKTESTKREYLTPEQLQAIEEIVLEKENAHLQKVLDMFLFACYTGLRFSDITSLSKDSIVVEDGKTWIDTTQQKTSSPLRIPLYMLFNNKPIEILNRYTRPDHKFIFDELTNQYVNRCLKDIAGLAKPKIKKTVTFHTARHTQATFLLYKGVNITTVQKLLGHKKLQTTQIYSKVMDMTIVNELKNVSF